MNIKFSLAVKHIQNSGIIAYPTEAVWGLGCDPYDREAVARLLHLKQRSPDKGLILVGSSLDQVSPLLAPLSLGARTRCQSSWPGPYTWILPDIDGLTPSWIKGKYDGVAVRISHHPVVAELCEAWGGLLVSTSANFAEQKPAGYAWKVSQRFSGHVRIVPGKLGGLAAPSVIRHAESEILIRS